ncbi:hypothetical protein K0651_01980 [Ornithinimicrobium sp. Arc0846-15]|nr:hypothetical protein [Ornithinimicrobium laminariae]
MSQAMSDVLVLTAGFTLLLVVVAAVEGYHWRVEQLRRQRVLRAHRAHGERVRAMVTGCAGGGAR